MGLDVIMDEHKHKHNTSKCACTDLTPKRKRFRTSDMYTGHKDTYSNTHRKKHKIYVNNSYGFRLLEVMAEE